MLVLLFLAGCGRSEVSPGVTDITGVMPDLHFSMTRANDGAGVSEKNYRDKVVILYFGYTHCPDICPATLTNLSNVLKALGARASDVRVLFVTVDPNRDTDESLKSYVSAFAPQIDGLRGTPDQLTRLARRYRVLYSVTAKGNDTEVMHSDAVFFFEKNGDARLVATSTENTDALTQDVTPLIAGR